MTDSDSEVSNRNFVSFPNANTTVSARGPNTNITNFSFRNQLTSTMFLPRNFERQRYAESLSDQKSIYYRRETSPMSIHSACDIRPRNYQHYNRMGSQQSVFNGRSGSPMSVRSIESSASVSAADIAHAFKNVTFNKYDLKVIKEAYQRLMKQRVRKRIEKRRNMRLFLKGSRNRSGDDSGEQGSDSSISSDDCRSVKTSYKENMVCNRPARDLVDFQKTVRDRNMLRDCTDNMMQHSLKNMFTAGNANQSKSQHFKSSSFSKTSHVLPTQKDRFRNGFLLPSQRFNQSVASSVIPESSERSKKKLQSNYTQNDVINCMSNVQRTDKNCESGSDEEIFTDILTREKPSYTNQNLGKRSLDSDDDSSLPQTKKTKISSPINYQPTKKVPARSDKFNHDVSNNFEFAKPMLPVMKSRPKVKETVIAKSKQPLTGFVEPRSNQITNNIDIVEPIYGRDNAEDSLVPADKSETTQMNDVSMRPSFIKRKLFTQKLDVAEKSNLSHDGVNSPNVNVYSAFQKEKNKARKLVTSQSCLYRDVQDDSNLLDLIHKIVPPDQMNVTNQTSINQTKSIVNNSNKKDNNNCDEDNWDVTSVMSMCNEHDVSDTFTDEEIFETNDKNNVDKKHVKESSSKMNPKTDSISKPVKNVMQNLPQQCTIVVEKINFQSLPVKNNNGNDTKNTARTFWDTDFESDVECQVKLQKSHTTLNHRKGNHDIGGSRKEFNRPDASISRPLPNNNLMETSRWLENKKDATVMNNTLDSTRKFSISTLSVRSHRTMKKKVGNDTSTLQVASKQAISSITSVNNTGKPSGTQNNDKNISKSGTHEKKTKSNNRKVSKGNKSVTKSSEKYSLDKKTSKKDIKDITPPKSTNINKKASNKGKVAENYTKAEKNITLTKKADQSSNEPNKKMHMKSNKKTEVSTKTTTEEVKLKLNDTKVNKRSTSRTRKETEAKSITTKKTNLKMSNQHSPNGRPTRTLRTPSRIRPIENCRSSLQFDISPIEIKPHRTRQQKYYSDNSLNESSQPEINFKAKSRQHSKNTTNKSVIESNIRRPIKKLNVLSAVLPTRKSPRHAKPTPTRDRPMRTCRTPSQNISMKNYKSSVIRR